MQSFSSSVISSPSFCAISTLFIALVIVLFILLIEYRLGYNGREDLLAIVLGELVAYFPGFYLVAINEVGSIILLGLTIF